MLILYLVLHSNPFSFLFRFQYGKADQLILQQGFSISTAFRLKLQQQIIKKNFFFCLKGLRFLSYVLQVF